MPALQDKDQTSAEQAVDKLTSKPTEATDEPATVVKASTRRPGQATRARRKKAALKAQLRLTDSEPRLWQAQRQGSNTGAEEAVNTGSRASSEEAETETKSALDFKEEEETETEALDNAATQSTPAKNAALAKQLRQRQREGARARQRKASKKIEPGLPDSDPRAGQAQKAEEKTAFEPAKKEDPFVWAAIEESALKKKQRRKKNGKRGNK